MSGGSSVSGGAGYLRPRNGHCRRLKCMEKAEDLPDATSFISSLKQGRFPQARLVLRCFHDHLEGRQSGDASADDADIHGVLGNRWTTPKGLCLTTICSKAEPGSSVLVQKSQRWTPVVLVPYTTVYGGGDLEQKPGDLSFWPSFKREDWRTDDRLISPCVLSPWRFDRRCLIVSGSHLF